MASITLERYELWQSTQALRSDHGYMQLHAYEKIYSVQCQTFTDHNRCVCEGVCVFVRACVRVCGERVHVCVQLDI